MTFMNRSGQAVAALAQFYKIKPEEILVVHDELDIPCGRIKFKLGGGNGGHNGLKDIRLVWVRPISTACAWVLIIRATVIWLSVMC